MYSEVTLPDRVRDYLSALGRPIRVLNGHAWQFTPPRSWRGAATANNTTLADCEERGLTIVSWGADEVGAGGIAWVPQWSATFFDGGSPRDGGRDWVIPQGRPTDDDSFVTDAGNIWARTGERVVWVMTDLGALHEDVNLDTFLGRPIERALSDHWAEERERQERERREREQAEEERLMRERAEASARAREQFIVRMRGNMESRKERLVRLMGDHETNIRRYEQTIRTYMVERRDAIAELKAIEAIGDDFGESEFDEQWEQLLAHPKVTEVSIDGDYLVVHTIPLNIKCPDTEQEAYLGKFHIKIPAYSGSEIMLVNTDNPKYDGSEGVNRDHPHVLGQRPCWGDAHSVIANLRNENQIPALVEVIFQYLESYNPEDSWGANIDLWMDAGTADEAEAARNGDEGDATADGYDRDADCNCYDCRAERLGYDPDR